MNSDPSGSHVQQIVIGLPAYNEEKYIGSVILAARKYSDKVVVVDDGSTDDTAEIAKLAGATVVQHEGNQGYGATIQDIFLHARKINADVLIILDADGQHKPDEIPAVLEGIRDGYDVVIGSREKEQNKISRYRRFGQKVLSGLTHVASKSQFWDTESGFRAYSKKAIQMLELKEKGMAISSEIVTEAISKGLRISEVPISVIYTQDGSTLNPVKHGLSNMNRIMIMISERRPLLFFGLFGGFFVILGLAAGIVVVRSFYFESNVLAVGTALVSILLITIGLLTLFTGIILNVLVRRLKDKV
jgi:glycosyltransferase involved in cell wall biosynthesis